MIAITIKGAVELERKLLRLDKKVGKKVVRKALRDGGKIVLRAVKSEIPVSSGTMRRAFVLRGGKKNRPGTFAMLEYFDTKKFPQLVGQSATGKRSFYPVAVSAGHAAPFDAGGTKITRGQQFVRPGFDKSKDAAERRIIRQISAGIQRVFREKR